MRTNGTTCIVCDALVKHEEREIRKPVDLGDCTFCGEIACVVPVWVNECEDLDCLHEDHHYGHQCHVKELD